VPGESIAAPVTNLTPAMCVDDSGAWRDNFDEFRFFTGLLDCSWLGRSITTINEPFELLDTTGGRFAYGLPDGDLSSPVDACEIWRGL
jgi:hypothetical protein